MRAIRAPGPLSQRIPSPKRKSGSFVLDGTSLGLSTTACIEDGRSKGRRPRGCASPRSTSAIAWSRSSEVDQQCRCGFGDIGHDRRPVQVEINQGWHRFADLQDAVAFGGGVLQRAGVEAGFEDARALLPWCGQPKHGQVGVGQVGDEGAQARRIVAKPFDIDS